MKDFVDSVLSGEESPPLWEIVPGLVRSLDNRGQNFRVRNASRGEIVFPEVNRSSSMTARFCGSAIATTSLEFSIRTGSMAKRSATVPGMASNATFSHRSLNNPDTERGNFH